MSGIRIDVWSDLACPWCYVGKVVACRLDEELLWTNDSIQICGQAFELVFIHLGSYGTDPAKLVKQFKQQPQNELPIVSFRLRHPYMIDVNTNNVGEEYLAYNQRRWGSDGWTMSLRRSAAKDGLQFKDWQWWPNTLHAHRLVLLADRDGKSGEAKQRLFKMTYEDGLNISDLDVLCTAADQLGISGGRDYLMSDEGKEEVMRQDRAAKSERKISSVPYFIINGTYSLSGAQNTTTIEKALHKAIGL